MAWNSSIQAQQEADKAWSEALLKRSARLADRQRSLGERHAARGSRRRKKRKPPKLGWFNPDGSVNYRLYMRSPDWRERRRRYFETHAKVCRQCNSREDIHLHHKTYENFGMELDCDLEPLCETCHKAHHAMS